MKGSTIGKATSAHPGNWDGVGSRPGSRGFAKGGKNPRHAGMGRDKFMGTPAGHSKVSIKGKA